MAESRYSIELVTTICSRMAEGSSTTSACREIELPVTTFMTWLKDHPEAAEQYARAREARGMYYGERISEIADRTLNGEYDPAAARVAVDALKWTAARMAPKGFGDKVQAEISGPNGGPIQVTRIEIVPGDNRQD